MWGRYSIKWPLSHTNSGLGPAACLLHGTTVGVIIQAETWKVLMFGGFPSIDAASLSTSIWTSPGSPAGLEACGCCLSWHQASCQTSQDKPYWCQRPLGTSPIADPITRWCSQAGPEELLRHPTELWQIMFIALSHYILGCFIKQRKLNYTFSCMPWQCLNKIEWALFLMLTNVQI